jgi:pentatricopeptide repeat protein
MSSSPDRRAIVKSGTTLFITILLHVVGDTSAGEPPKSMPPAKLLGEARTVASFLSEPADRSSALESILLAQVSIDPGGARETLKSFPGLPNRTNHFASLALVYAKEGNIDEAERMYAEIRSKIALRDKGNWRPRIPGYVAAAYANAAGGGRLPIVSQLGAVQRGSSR